MKNLGSSRLELRTGKGRPAEDFLDALAASFSPSGVGPIAWTHTEGVLSA